MDILSEFFERINLKGHIFYAGKVEGTLHLNKPAGTVFIHVLAKGGVDLIKSGCTTISVHEPSLLLCPTTCQYKLRANSSLGAEIICGSFEFGESMGLMFPLGITETMIFPFHSIDNVVPAIATLIAEFGSSASGRKKALNILFEYIFILLVRKAIDQGLISTGVLYAMLEGKLENVLSAIHEEPERDWSLAQLADIANMSRSKFSLYFNSILGVSPFVYLTSWRMKMAQDLMVQRVQLKVVASSVGYSSQAAFTRTFVHQFGLPPSEWLKRNALL
jgi:AraC-like DNA-binding protein